MTSFNFLLVDAEKAFIENTAQRLRHKDFTAECAFSGMEALNLLEKNNTIDVVVIDINMPDLHDMSIIETLKKKHPLVEIVILTGHPTFHSAIEAMKSGAFEYLTKPCELDNLISTAERAVTRKREREAKILDARMKPYISERERKALMSEIMGK
ncbi:MAG: response regulator [Proteobacteria bacterium]|nr:response regulator [Pseudomonadota bacterium]MBU1139519.1 response regulator [Pseudomonadota bacterium]